MAGGLTPDSQKDSSGPFGRRWITILPRPLPRPSCRCPGAASPTHMPDLLRVLVPLPILKRWLGSPSPSTTADDIQQISTSVPLPIILHTRSRSMHISTFPDRANRSRSSCGTIAAKEAFPHPDIKRNLLVWLAPRKSRCMKTVYHYESKRKGVEISLRRLRSRKCRKHFAVRWLLSRRVSMHICRSVSLSLSKTSLPKEAAVAISVCRRGIMLVHARLKLAARSFGCLFRRSGSRPVDGWLCLLGRW